MTILVFFLLTAAAIPLVSFQPPPAILKGVGFPLSISLKWPAGDNTTSLLYDLTEGDKVISSGSLNIVDEEGTLLSETTIRELTIDSFGYHNVLLCVSSGLQESCAEGKLHVIPGALSLVPTFIILVVAVITRQVLFALSIGCFLNCVFLYDYNPFTAFLRFLDVYLVNSIADRDHSYVLLFVVFLGGMIGIIQKGGGAFVFAKKVARYCRGRRHLQIVAFFLGWVIFFDDYSNALILGTTLLPIMDRMSVSREKFAFIVDCTSAPISSLAPISSWVGYEISLIDQALKQIQLKEDPYLVFLKTLPYRFYPWLMLFFLFFLILSARDFGPMLSAERRAMNPSASPQLAAFTTPSTVYDGKTNMIGQMKEGLDFPIEHDPSESSQSDVEDGPPPTENRKELGLRPVLGKPRRIGNALCPIFLTLALSVVGIVLTGYYSLGEDEFTLQNLLSHGDSFGALLWASFCGSAMAVFLVTCQRILTFSDAMETWITGVGSVLESMLILIFAWAVGTSTQDLQAGEFVTSMLSKVNPGILPTLIFVVSTTVAFATGTSWGSMAIMFPLTLPLANTLSGGDPHLIYTSIASILSGAVFGDHISPISDTTILTCLSTNCDLMAHVKTQLPYAFLVATVSIVLGDIMIGFDYYPVYVTYLLAPLTFLIFIFLFGRKLDDEEGDSCSKCWSWFQKALTRPNRATRGSHGSRSSMSGSRSFFGYDEYYGGKAPLRLDYQSSFGAFDSNFLNEKEIYEKESNRLE